MRAYDACGDTQVDTRTVAAYIAREPAALITACVSHCAARVNFTKYHTEGAEHGHSLRETRPANESENSGGSFPHVSSHVLDN